MFPKDTMIDLIVYHISKIFTKEQLRFMYYELTLENWRNILDRAFKSKLENKS